MLVDLTAQPDDIKIELDLCVEEAAFVKRKPMVGAQFLKFCGKYDLVKLSENANTFGDILSAAYPE